MAQSEERPSKIRRLGSSLEDDQVADFAPHVDRGIKNTYEAVNSTQDDGAETPPSASKDEGDTSSLNIQSDDDVCENSPSQHLSKNRLKKLLKKQNWEEGREYRKTKRREKGKQKKARKAEARAALESRNAEDAAPAPEPPNRTARRPVQLPITFVLDCDFDDLMTEAELISLGAQLTRCYSDNRSASFKAHLVISSFDGKLKHRFETVLASNHLGWKGVKFIAEDFVNAGTGADAVMRGPQGGQLLGAFATVTSAVKVQHRLPYQSTGTSQSSVMNPSTSPSVSVEEVPFGAKQPAINGIATTSTEQTHAVVTNNSRDMLHDAYLGESHGGINSQNSKISGDPSIIYLTSDSPNTLDILSPYTTYIIGGIVDKNRHKGICYKRAMAREIPTAKLPIGEYMTMQSRSVLATNHVAEIMLKWLECGDWAKAFLQVIPKRKEARLKAEQGTPDDPPNKEGGHTRSNSHGD